MGYSAPAVPAQQHPATATSEARTAMAMQPHGSPWDHPFQLVPHVTQSTFDPFGGSGDSGDVSTSVSQPAGSGGGTPQPGYDLSTDLLGGSVIAPVAVFGTALCDAGHQRPVAPSRSSAQSPYRATAPTTSLFDPFAVLPGGGGAQTQSAAPSSMAMFDPLA